uniref:Uncharacterized protein n=1 Tax=Arundo donax TaxID=35708 RepID=A0A0A9GU19_ARUDO
MIFPWIFRGLICKTCLMPYYLGPSFIASFVSFVYFF